MRYPNQIVTQANNTQTPPEKAYLRFLNALPNNPSTSVDIYVNNHNAVKNLNYQDFTKYMPLAPGDYSIQVYPSGNSSTPLLVTNIVVFPTEMITASLTSSPEAVELETYSDYPKDIDPTLAQMRFINLSSESPVDVFIDNTPIVYDLGYTEQTEYIPLSPGRHTMDVRLSGNQRSIIHHPNVMLKGGNYYASFMTGNATTQPVMEVLIPLEGASYLDF